MKRILGAVVFLCVVVVCCITLPQIIFAAEKSPGEKCIIGQDTCKSPVNGKNYECKAEGVIIQPPKEPPPPPPPCKGFADGGCSWIDTSLGVFSTQPNLFVTRVVSIIIASIGGIALLLIMRASYKIMTSRGKPEALKEGTEQLTAALIGLGVALFAFLLLGVLFQLLKIPGVTTYEGSALAAGVAGGSGRCRFTSKSTTPSGPATPPNLPGNWTLVFSDDFDGTAVDTNKWLFTSTAEADCEGNGKTLESGCRNPNNQQMEFNWGNNCKVAGGILTIEAKKQTKGSSSWTSCMLHSIPQFQTMYMEARVKMPATNGFWPGFWTWNGPQNEVDVFEYYTQAKQFDMTNRIGGGSHCSPPAGFDPTNDFHTYAADISTKGVAFYIDGKEICPASGGAPSQPVSLLLDLFVHDRQQQAANSAIMETDFIRAWQKQ